ncbi:uncharacterized protein LOC126903008 [Daktulosphaira vitifoliae]|uniref:uncharacterized protein LOC126903008 n=1 Tax=Daktulosphaira vitifoliae TaxID=58002 RepID=UPI0021AA1A4D|nr:uncharacterized protein LOC126903008 [Daktulosphaira vitifoliae]
MLFKYFEVFVLLQFIVLLKETFSCGQKSKKPQLNRELNKTFSPSLKKLARKLSFKSNRVIDAVVNYPSQLCHQSIRTSDFNFVELKNEHFFQPIDIEYCQYKFKHFENIKFEEQEIKNYYEPRNLLEKLTIPKKVDMDEKYKGTTFKTVSLILTNTDENHLAIQKIVYEEFLKSTVVNNLMNSENAKKKYLEQKMLENNGVLIGKLEWFVVAQAFDICIYIYDESEFYWILFDKNWPNYEHQDMKSKKCIYLFEAHYTSDFYPVVDIY